MTDIKRALKEVRDTLLMDADDDQKAVRIEAIMNNHKRLCDPFDDEEDEKSHENANEMFAKTMKKERLRGEIIQSISDVEDDLDLSEIKEVFCEVYCLLYTDEDCED